MALEMEDSAVARLACHEKLLQYDVILRVRLAISGNDQDGWQFTLPGLYRHLKTLVCINTPKDIYLEHTCKELALEEPEHHDESI